MTMADENVRPEGAEAIMPESFDADAAALPYCYAFDSMPIIVEAHQRHSVSKEN